MSVFVHRAEESLICRRQRLPSIVSELGADTLVAVEHARREAGLDAGVDLGMQDWAGEDSRRAGHPLDVSVAITAPGTQSIVEPRTY